MRKILAFALVMIMIAGSALADYEMVDTTVFLEYAGAKVDYVFEKLEKRVISYFGIVAADKIGSEKNSGFELPLNGPFVMGIGESSNDNQIILILYNDVTGKYRTCYIDLDTGLLYQEKKENNIDYMMEHYFWCCSMPYAVCLRWRRTGGMHQIFKRNLIQKQKSFYAAFGRLF